MHGECRSGNRRLASALLSLFLALVPVATGADIVTNPAAAPASVSIPTPSEKAMRFYRTGNVLWIARTLWSLAVPIALLVTGVSALFRSAAVRVGRNWLVALCCYTTLLVLLQYLMDLPLNFYGGFMRPHEYDLSNQPLAKWWMDSLKELGLAWIVAVCFLWVPFCLMRRSPRRWWFYTGLLTIPYLLVAMFLLPIFVEPLFNKFGPMKDRALESRIQAIAEKAGIAGGRILEVDKSVDTKTVNAYVSGFLGSKRIVLWDTIIARLTPEELLFVMGHEMGHYVLGHVWKSILVFAALVMAALYGIHRVAPSLIERHGERFGFKQLSDFASLPLCVLLLNTFSLVLTPVGYAYSRYQEHEADRFGLEITRNNQAAALSFAKLQEQNLSNPHPGSLHKIWRATHPPLGERIDFLNRYRPWEQGLPSKYERYFSTGRIPGKASFAEPAEELSSTNRLLNKPQIENAAK